MRIVVLEEKPYFNMILNKITERTDNILITNFSLVNNVCL